MVNLGFNGLSREIILIQILEMVERVESKVNKLEAPPMWCFRKHHSRTLLMNASPAVV